MRNRFNICSGTDSYKLCHHSQYLNGTERVYAYFESREGAKYPETVFFGLQYILMEYLAGYVVTQEKIDRAAALCSAHMGDDTIFNRAMWEHILVNHNGKLPIRIKAVPEGTPVNVGNVLMTVENLDHKCWALTNHLETILSHVWYASNVATISRAVKKDLKKWIELSVDENGYGALDFMLHDFGFRGASCIEAAGIGGAGHLVNFKGTDTIRAIEVLQDYYCAEEMPGFSVPATEHSVMTAGGPEGERAVVSQLLKNHPNGILSIVIDSYNAFEFITEILGRDFKDQILRRDGVVVARPDSGDPVPTMLECLERLLDAFGGTKNDKGYMVINPSVKVLWGDGLTHETINEICEAITGDGWSMANIATFGMGGGLLQRHDRDTQRSAFKCSAQMRNGQWRDIYKDPIDSSKASKRGKLKLVKNDWGYSTSNCHPYRDEMNVVFEMGEITYMNALADIRKRAAIG